MENAETTTRRNTDSSSVMYLTAVKVAQYRQVAENRIEKEEGKKVTVKNKDKRKVHLQLKIYEAFERCIKSMNSLSSSNTYIERLIQIIQQ